MIDDEIRSLVEQAPERALDRLESDIWAGVAARERQAAALRRVVAIQAVVLTAAVAGSVIAGRHIGAADTREVDVFSPHMSLSAATLLTGDGS